MSDTRACPRQKSKSDQDRKNLIADLVRQVLKHQDKETLVKEFAEQPQRGVHAPKARARKK